MKADAAIMSTASALNAWIDAVALRFPRRARFLRRMTRSRFWLAALLKARSRA